MKRPLFIFAQLLWGLAVASLHFLPQFGVQDAEWWGFLASLILCAPVSWVWYFPIQFVFHAFLPPAVVAYLGYFLVTVGSYYFWFRYIPKQVRMRRILVSA